MPTEFNDPAGVTELLQNLVHPMKPVIEEIRSTILKCDQRITEGIKWNAPSFYCHGWFATFHLRAKVGVMLVLHQGAKVRIDSKVSSIADPKELLTWASADRATITFADARDFKLKKSALKAIIQQWVEFQVDLAAST